MGMMIHRKASLRNQGAVKKKTAPVVSAPKTEEVKQTETVAETENIAVAEDAAKKDVPKYRRRRKNV